MSILQPNSLSRQPKSQGDKTVIVKSVALTHPEAVFFQKNAISLKNEYCLYVNLEQGLVRKWGGS
jgi:hypothetical protein